LRRVLRGQDPALGLSSLYGDDVRSLRRQSERARRVLPDLSKVT